MRKTKIVCTIGPKSRDKDCLGRLVQAGMNVARLNFSHDTKEVHKRSIEKIREVSDQASTPVAILQDLAGPKIRIGVFEEESITLESGQQFILTKRDIKGNEKEVSLNYKKLPEDVEEGNHLLLADGSLELEVLKTDGTDITCEVIIGGELSSRKGVNLPDTAISAPTLTEKDRSDLKFGLENNVDYVALSFVRTANEIKEVKNIIAKSDNEAGVIAKIEKNEALENLDEILEEVEGIMIARGDLGVETPIEKVPGLQKDLTHKAKKKGKLVITATQMLKSMVDNPRPTRAEVTDVANAIYDGTDAVMLSEETAIGNYPVKTVEMMNKIALDTEAHFPYEEWNYRFNRDSLTIQESVARSACEMSQQVNAAGIITLTYSGSTAHLVSRHRPCEVLFALTPNKKTYHKLALVWGAYPICMKWQDTLEKMENQSIRSVVKSGLIGPNEPVVITAGIPLAESGITNLLTVLETEEIEQ